MPDLSSAIVGGSSSASFPVDSTCPKCVQFCKEIDGRFYGQTFANPALFNPATSERLRKSLTPYAKASDPFEPLVVWRNYIPQEHVIRGVAIHVQEVSDTCCPDRRCRKSNPAGMELSVVARLMDHAKYCEDCACDPSEYYKGELIEIATGIDPTTHDWTHLPLDMAVGAGELLLYGFRIDKLPDDAEGLNSLSTQVAAVIVGDQYSHPLQMD